jgi:hypothetical protein
LAEAWVLDDQTLAADEQMVMSSEASQCALFPFPHVYPFQVFEDQLAFQQQGFGENFY